MNPDSLPITLSNKLNNLTHNATDRSKKFFDVRQSSNVTQKPQLGLSLSQRVVHHIYGLLQSPFDHLANAPKSTRNYPLMCAFLLFLCDYMVPLLVSLTHT